MAGIEYVSDGTPYAVRFGSSVIWCAERGGEKAERSLPFKRAPSRTWFPRPSAVQCDSTSTVPCSECTNLNPIPPAHRKVRDERGTASPDSAWVLTEFDRVTCQDAFNEALQSSHSPSSGGPSLTMNFCTKRMIPTMIRTSTNPIGTRAIPGIQ